MVSHRNKLRPRRYPAATSQPPPLVWTSDFRVISLCKPNERRLVPMIRESAAGTRSGMFMLFLLPLLMGMTVWWFVVAIQHVVAWQMLGSVFVFGLLAIGLGGFFVVEPNQASVLLLFGNYRGSERRPGLWWANPFMTKKRVTMRVRNFESSKLKVNDHDGNPIEIAAVVVWRVVDSAEAIFQVD